MNSNAIILSVGSTSSTVTSMGNGAPRGWLTQISRVPSTVGVLPGVSMSMETKSTTPGVEPWLAWVRVPPPGSAASATTTAAAARGSARKARVVRRAGAVRLIAVLLPGPPQNIQEVEVKNKLATERVVAYDAAHIYVPERHVVTRRRACWRGAAGGGLGAGLESACRLPPRMREL